VRSNPFFAVIRATVRETLPGADAIDTSTGGAPPTAAAASPP
jgi:hypothetical protein